MADVESNIHVNIDTSDALASLKLLQRQISAFHTQMAKSGTAAAAVAANQAQNLMNSINATGQFQASMRTVTSSTESFTNALEKNKLTSREYFRYTGAATKTFGKLFKSEFETINKVARERVKDIQTQYVKLGRGANGALQAIAVRPLTLDMKNLGTQTAIAAQRQQLLNQLLKQGSTNLLNFGKNTQWAGRQLMVGFTVPLAMLGATASKTFMKLEEQAIRFKRVYGEMFTTQAETDAMVKQVQKLATEYTKYGVAIEDTMKMAADAAAMGKQGAELLAQISQATRLAVLGGVDQAQALETTISVTNAFGVAADQLAGKIDFLNAVENQTVVSIEDLTTAIPKAGPVVKQLGGSVEDLAFFLTAMKEGGINASEGANALKSGLASLINPSDKASKMLAGLGINIKGIVEANKGDVKSTVIDFAKALDTLDPLNRARAIEQLFGKFQFSRLSTLFQNVTAEGTQASRVLELTRATTEELAILSERELGKIEETTTYKFKKSIEDLKVTLAPVGEQFLKALTPIVEFASKILDKFNDLGDGSKKFITILTLALGAVGPLALMSFGLLANGIANIIKLFTTLRGGFQKAGSSTQILGEQTNYLTKQQLEASAVAASLDQVHQKLRQTFTSEASAVGALALAYQRALSAQQAFGMPIGMRPGAVAKKFAGGGIVFGPGGPTSDSVPIMASNGEAIISAGIVKKYPGLVNGLIAGNIPGYKNAGIVGSKSVKFGGSDYSLPAGSQTIKAIQAKVDSSIGTVDDIIAQALKNLASETKISTKMFVKEVRSIAQAEGRRVADLGKEFASKSEKRVGGGGAYAAPKSLGSPADQLRRERGAVAAAAEMAPARASAKAIRRTMEKYGATQSQIANATQIDRSHTVAVSKEQKGVKTGIKTGMKSPAWNSAVWTPQTGAENNSILESLKKSEKYRKVYQEYLVKTGATEKQIASIMSNVNNGVALTEEQLSIQGKALRKIAADSQTNAAIEKQTSKNFIMYADAVGQGALAREKVLARQPKQLRDLTVRNQEAIQAIANELPNAAALALQTKSPSRKMRKVGQDAGAGLVLGAREYIDDAKATGQALGAATVQGSQSKAAASRTALYGTGPIDANQKSIRRQLQLQQKRSALAQKSAYPASVITAGSADSAKKQTLSSRMSSVSQKIKDRRAERKEAGKSMGAGGKMMAASGVMMAASMIPGQVGDTAQKLMMPMMALTAVMPLLTSAVGIAGVAIGAVAATLYYFNQNIKKAREEGIALANAMSMGTNKIKELSLVTGKVSASEAAKRKRETVVAGTSEQQRRSGQTILQSGFGKTLMSDINTQAKQGMGTEAIGKNISTNLAQAIMQGIITTDQAKSIASALGEQLGDYSIPATITGDLVQLLGPNGENLYTDPLSVALTIKANTMQNVQDAFSQAVTGANADAVYKSMPWWKKAFDGVAAGIAPNLMPFSNNAVGAANAKLDAAAVQTGAMAIQQNQAQIDALNKQYEIKKQNAKTDKEALALEDERKAKVESLNRANKQSLDEVKTLSKSLSGKEFTAAINTSIDALYKDAPEAIKTFVSQAKDQLGTLQDTPFKKTIQLGFASGDLNASTVSKIVAASAEDKDFSSRINLLIEQQGFANTDMIMQLLSKTGAKASTISVMLNYVNTNKESFDTDLNAVEALSRFKDQYGITLDLKTNGVKQMQIASAALTAIAPLPEKLDFALITKLAGEDPATFAGVKADWAALSEGKDTINKNLVVNYLVGKADPNVVNAANNEFRGKGLSESTGVATYIAKGFITPPAKTFDKPTNTNDNKGIDSSPLDDLVKRLRDVRKNQIKVTEGFEASSKALNKLFGGNKTLKIFSGIENDMRKLGAGEDLIDLIVGMDPKDYEKQKNKLFKFDEKGNISGIKDTAKSIQDAIQSIKLGEFVSEQERMARQIGDQTTALTRLKAAGVEGSIALEAVADATFAAAIANKKLDDGQIKKIVNAWREATIQKKNYAAVEAIQSEETALDDNVTLLTRMTETMGQFSQEQLNAIMQSENLKKALVNLASVKPGSKNYEDFLRVLQKALNKEKVQLQIDAVSIEGMQKIFDRGFSNAMDQADVKQKTLQLKFDIDTEDLQNKIDKAQDEIDANQYKIDQKNAALREIEKQEQKINDKYDERVKALDEIEKANATISQQQKGQLTLAEALTSGDIAAAAKAAQDMRAQAAADAVTKEKDALEQSRQAELSRVTQDGKTRKDLEQEISDLEDKIFDLENNKIKPAQEEIRQKSVTLREEIKQLDIFRRGWELLQNQVDVARTNSAKFLQEMENAKNIVDKLVKAYKDEKADVLLPAGSYTPKPGETPTPEPKPGETPDPKPGETPTPEPKPGPNPEYRGNAGSTPDSAGTGNNGSGTSTPNGFTETPPTPYTPTWMNIDDPTARGHVKDLETNIAANIGRNSELFNRAVNNLKIAENAGTGAAMHYQDLNRLTDQMNLAKKYNTGPDYAKQQAEQLAANKAAAAKKAQDEANLKKFGGNAAAAQAFGNWSTGGLIPKYFAVGGFAKGTDTVPAMLTPGEFIMSKYAVDSYGVDNMRKINNGDSIGGTVYNNTYTLTVNAKTDANPNDIAQAVMSTIKKVDDRRIRGVSLNGR